MVQDNDKGNQNEPQPGTPEYDEMMANKARQARQGPQDEPDIKPEMPEGGLEKYWNPETGEYNWEAHAKELLFNANGRQQPSQGDDEGGNEGGDQNGPLQIDDEAADEAANDIVTKAGLNPEELGQQIARDGDISDEAKEALEQQGIPRELIDDYIEGVKARMAAARQESLEYVGGEDEWKQLSEWAAQNLTETEKEEVNRLLASPNWKLAIDGLKARYQTARPGSREGKLETGAKTSADVPSGYTSRAQMKADMADPRYQSDPAFRAEVAKKIKYATWSDEPSF